MAKSIYNSYGEKGYGLLLAGVQAEPVSVPLYPTAGTYKAGTLLYRTSNGMYAPAASGQLDGSYLPAVLAEDIVIASGETVAPAVAAYASGTFVDGAIVLSDGTSKPTASHKIQLAKFGIRFAPEATTAPDFNNGSYVITYVANNGAEPAEANVVDHKIHGVSYTVLANSVTDFTAPATKSFSKWNTKADGSGTDYAAAATYSTDADLTLYAVWA